MSVTREAYQWIASFDAVGGPTLLRRHLVIVAGPSGAGKTAVSCALAELDPAFEVLRNFTTRAPRPTDQDGHFAYLSDQTFLKAQGEDQFFLCRLAPRPRYGYMAKDFAHLAAKGSRPVLMFRHAGTNYLAKSLGCVPTIFIEAEPAQVARHSRNTESPPTEKDVENTIAANRRLQRFMAQKQWPYLCITNHYRGDEELRTITEIIKDFLDVTNRP